MRTTGLVEFRAPSRSRAGAVQIACVSSNSDASEKVALVKAHELSGGKIVASKALGISKSAIYRKLRTHGVE